MDKFRIQYKCNKAPRPSTGLEGFMVDHMYVGRSYNGLFEVTPQWGNGKQTKLLRKNEFEQYFELVTSRLLQPQQKQQQQVA